MRIGIIGGGSWGTALGIVLGRRGLEVELWARSSGDAIRLNKERRNVDRLPDHEFPPSMAATASIQEVVGRADLVIVAVPSSTMRENARRVGPFLNSNTVVLSCTKGLERDTGKRMSEVLAEELPESAVRKICVLSGPNLSKEIVSGMPASTVIAGQDEAVAVQVRDVIMSSTIRVYTNSDVIGIELGGALKNVVAIGAGISDGLGFGDNAKAAFMTRGLVEITRLGIAAGANPLSFAGLACLGDLIATSSSRLSRNYFVGEQLAKGRPVKMILSNMRYVAEGVDTTVAALVLAKRMGVEIPIIGSMYQVLFEGKEPQAAVRELMARAPIPEWQGVRLS